MKITIPELCFVLLVGPSGSGKSTFARKHFRPTEVLSSDFFRGLVCDDEGNQAASKDAFEVLHLLAARRLAWAKLTVIDATNVKPEARKPLLQLTKEYHVQTVAIVFNLPEDLCQRYNEQRPERSVAPTVVTAHHELLQKTLAALEKEHVRHVHVLATPEEVESVTVERQRLTVNRRDEHGPFDVLGDVHGCFDELLELLGLLGYRVSREADPGGRPAFAVVPPEGRKAVFVGDLVDRGPNVPEVLRLVMGMVEAGTALCVRGNHDDKLLRKLNGHDVRVTHGLGATLEQLAPEPPELLERVRTFLEGLPSHYVLDGGKLVVAHAGLKEELQGRVSGPVRSFALFGDVTGAKDELGLPVRRNWAAEYEGRAAVVYGHTPVATADWVNRTINLDTGCVFGGRLTALRWPEKELVSVPARGTYAVPARPFLPPPADAPPATAADPAAPPGL
jgi:protein phosphatase